MATTRFIGVVLAFDHFLPQKHDDDPTKADWPLVDPRLHEFHVVVQIEGTNTCVRLRADRGEPLRLMHFEREATVDMVADFFREGQRLHLSMDTVPASRRDPGLGFHPMDRVVHHPMEIETAAPRSSFLSVAHDRDVVVV